MRFEKEKKKVFVVLIVAVAVFFCGYIFVNVFTNNKDKGYNVTGYTEIYIVNNSAQKGALVGENIKKISVPSDTPLPKEAISLDENVIKKMFFDHAVVQNEMVLMNSLNDGKTVPKDEKLDFSRLLSQTFAPGSIPSVVVDGTIIDIVEINTDATDTTVVSKAVVFKRVNETTIEFFLNPSEREILKEKALKNANLIITVYKSDEQPASPIK
ncbi:MAG: hypothetical protein Q8N88_05645 [Nanoarchaeota archaeon]|nr:hypothetical protein [Nanoarchaeota archaeon]